jgi:hypothetical protein
MSFLREKNGKLSHKRIISIALIIVSIIMGFMQLPIEYVYFFGGAGLVNVGMTVYLGIKRNEKDHPPPDDDPPPGGGK